MTSCYFNKWFDFRSCL